MVYALSGAAGSESTLVKVRQHVQIVPLNFFRQREEVEVIDAALFEKMDLFYLGREVDPATGATTGQPLLYRSRYLTTHGVILGMTGSGKTGLGMALIEEAAIDRIPVIVIDPKGDMGNLLLTFPDLAADDFLPWVDDRRAEQQGMSRQQLARQAAATWREGLRAWGQDGDRIRRMRDAADFALYTPGSSAGRPVSVLDSLEAPAADLLADTETLAGLVNSAISSILALVGIRADPLKSREHILLSSILLHFWRRNQDLDLETLISGVVRPPFERIGVFPLSAFYPRQKRMELAMQLNNIVASPAFRAWSSGEPLRIDELLYTPAGRPRVAIFSIAHLEDAERMFFVTMLLGRLIGWMRRQEGSTGLRCLLYMDEIAGYFPPNASPPAKRPMLMLLKQARAYGLGIVLSTQNPVDLDYKGLANIGTWFIGRLQTRQDQDRVLDGIAGGSSRFDRSGLRRILAGLRGRNFLMHSARRDEPVLFETRWVLSYLKGPISLAEMRPLLQRAGKEMTEPPLDRAACDVAAGTGTSETLPLLAQGIGHCFVPPPVAADSLQFAPWLAGSARVRFYSQRRGIDQTEEVLFRLPIPEEARVDWTEAEPYPVDPADLAGSPPAGATFLIPPSWLQERRNLKPEEKAFAGYLYHSRRLELMRVEKLKLESRPGESEAAFRQRVASLLREKREAEAAKVEERFRRKQRQLETRLEKARARLEKEEGDVRARGVDTALSFGVALFGALFGRKALSVSTASRTARGMRSAGRLMKEKGDVQRARDELARLEEEMESLSLELQEKLAAIRERFDQERFPLQRFALAPRRSDIFDVRVCLLWEPVFDLSGAEFGIS